MNDQLEWLALLWNEESRSITMLPKKVKQPYFTFTCVVLKSKLPLLKGLSLLAHAWVNENVKTNLKTSYSQRINYGFSTMSDGILDGIFLVVQSQNLSVKLFQRLLASGFFLCSVEYLSWFKATINPTVCSSGLFSTNLERELVQVRSRDYAMFLNRFVCVRAYFWKKADFTFPFYSRTASME